MIIILLLLGWFYHNSFFLRNIVPNEYLYSLWFLREFICQRIGPLEWTHSYLFLFCLHFQKTRDCQMLEVLLRIHILTPRENHREINNIPKLLVDLCIIFETENFLSLLCVNEHHFIFLSFMRLLCVCVWAIENV